MSVRPADMEERARLLAMSVAATSIADTAGFLTDLHKRIDESILRAVWVLPQIRKLSQSDDAFLSPLPPREEFAVAWPETLDVSAHASAQNALVECVVALRARDPNLQKRVDRLVPRRLTEGAFWRAYLAAVHTLLVSEAPTATEALDAHLARLPPRRPAAERRFAPAATLQSDGALDRERIVKFLDECAALVVSDATVDELSAAAPGAGEGLLLHLQLEFMEHMGIDRTLGVSQMDPKALVKKYPGDGALLGACQRLVHACAHADALARERAAQRPAADAAARRWPPAATLAPAGADVSDADLLSLLKGTLAWLEEAETTAQLIEGATRGVMPTHQLMRWLREYSEHRGLRHDDGVRAVFGRSERSAEVTEAFRQVANVFQRLPSAVAAAASQMRAVDAAAESAGKAAAAAPSSSSTPKAPPAGMRFAPAATLQSEGTLSRELILRFCNLASETLLSTESLALLGKASAVEASALSVTWQRELLEQLGVEKDWACAELGMAPMRFNGDAEVLKAFREFQMACGECQRRAAALRRSGTV